MNILITGAAGFIGSALTQLLLNTTHHKVMGVDNFLYNNQYVIQPLLANKNFEFHTIDVRELPNHLLKRADVVIGLAAIVGAPACAKNPVLSQETNVDAVASIVKRLSSQQRLIVPCTDSAYGATGSEACTEISPLNPITEYSIQKCEAEKLVLSHQNSISLRLATLFGTSGRTRFDLLVNDFTRTLFYKKELSLFESYFRRNAVHVRDVARAFYWMIGNSHYTGVFNVGNNAYNLTKKQFAEYIIKCLGYGVLTEGNGKDKDQRDYVVNNNKILKTGFTFEHTIEDAVKEVTTLCNCLTYEQTLRMGNV